MKLKTIPFFLLLILLLSNFFLAPVYSKLNFYEGYSDIRIDFLYQFFGVLVIVYLFPKKIKYPSDIFITVYLIFTLFSHVSLYSLFDVGEKAKNNMFVLFFILLLPIFTVRFLRRIKIKIRIKRLLKINETFIILFVFSFVISFVLIYKTYSFGGFSYHESYNRRLLARKALGSGGIINYCYSIVINGIMPFLVFLSVIHKKYLLLIFSILLSLIYFWSMGLKQPFFQIIFFSFIAYLIEKNFLNKIPISFLKLIAVIFVLSIFESVFFETYYINQIVTRRIFAVASQIQIYYFDAFVNLVQTNAYQSFFGLEVNGFSDVTYFIGDEYFQNPKNNANSNTFLYFLLKKGVLGYFFTVVVVCGFLSVIDRIYLDQKEKEYIFLSTIFGILILEQAFTTALLTSGVFIIFIIMIFTKFNNKAI